MSSLTKKRRRFIFTCLLIPVVLLCVFVVYPALSLFQMSFTDWNGIASVKNYIGLGNYKKILFDSKDVWVSLRNNLYYFFGHLVFIPIEMAVASMLCTKMKGANFFKSFAFLPYIINGVAISYAFAYFFSPVNGAFNEILQVLGLGSMQQNWLSNPKIVNFTLVFVSLWRYSGYHIVLFIAGFKSVSKDIVEAAIVDGASAFQLFRHIQIPGIRFVLSFILFDNVRGSLQAFEIPFVMTGGGPGYASSTFTLYTIETAFSYNNFGLAAAMAVIIMLLIAVIYQVQQGVISLGRRRGE